MAADHIRRNPLEDPVAFAGSMQRIWDSVDNRLGEMVYDNVFWNRTFKDVMHMAMRAVGWNLGTVRELAGAPVDAIKVLDYMVRGAPPEDTAPDLGKGAAARLEYERQKSTLQRIAEKAGHKIPYTLALIGTTMLLGAILTYAFTGKGPEEIKDYFFPPTGRKTKYGTKERISMPSYTKDLYEYGTMPMQTVINKANPNFGIIHAIYANEDFFGNPVRDPDAGTFEQMLDGAKYAAKRCCHFRCRAPASSWAPARWNPPARCSRPCLTSALGPRPRGSRAPNRWSATSGGRTEGLDPDLAAAVKGCHGEA